MHSCIITPSSKVVVGDVQPLTFAGSQYVPYGTYYDAEMGQQVDLYHAKQGMGFSNGCGSEWKFFHNNAKPHDDEQFSIKILCDRSHKHPKSHVLAAFQRQNLAHDARLAAPAHRIIKVIDKDKVYWGYLTGRCTGIGEYQGMGDLDDMWCDYDYNRDQARDAMQAALAALQEFDSAVDGNVDISDIEEKLEEAFNDKFPFDNYEDFAEDAVGSGVISLYNNLQEVDVSGTQNDWGDIGDTVDCMVLGGDLHSCNMGEWQGSVVCIDFGHHSIRG